MLDNRYDLSTILAFYPVLKPGAAAVHPNEGGFSGSLVWRLATEQGVLCLRRWPAEYTDAGRLRWIHRVLAGVFETGFRRVPVPLTAAGGETAVRHGGHLWQLEPWLPGEAADAGQLGPQSEKRIEAALTALAEFHRAVAETGNRQPDGPAPGIVKRMAKISELMNGGLKRLKQIATAGRNLWPELADRAPAVLQMFTMLAPGVATRLGKASKQVVAIRPAIRDIHREHVLFEGDQVSGIVDFGAMQFDHVAADIARLLGSLAGDDRQLWQHGFQAYEKVHPLTDDERRLVPTYNESERLLAGMNWLWWVFVDGRRFANRTAVLARFDEIVTRLAAMIGSSPNFENVAASVLRRPAVFHEENG
jgi:Ser/Thr protein kinase RdoA (MazF antagonist)